MSTTDIPQWIYARVESPWIVLLIIPIAILIIFFLKKQFIALNEDLQTREQKRKIRKIMFFTRIIVIFLLLVALASPYIHEERTIEGEPFIQLLIDNSTSMELFENAAQGLPQKLEKKLGTEVTSIGRGITSNIGDGILNNLQPHSSILLVSDGNANTGSRLGDVALFASKLNTTINILKLTENKKDAHVIVVGSSKTMEQSENTFQVHIGKIGVGAVHLTVTLDGESVYDQTTNDNVVEFTRTLAKGTHKIVAKIDSPDYFPQNNVFYKTVKSVPQPKILLVSDKTSPLETLFKQLYLVDTSTSIPANIAPYYGIVVNDMSAEKINTATDALNDYAAEGNGLLVVGGENSFDRGGYKGSTIETILPVQTGSGEQEEGDVVVAIIIDISGSTSSALGGGKAVDVEKALAIGAYRDLRIDTRLAVVAFNTQAYLISEPSMVFEKKDLEGTLARLKDGGGTNIGAGIMKGIDVIKDLPGSKNIILISDGKTHNSVSAYESARFAANLGIKIYSVGVGETTDEQFMMDMADISNGIYFRATEESKLKLLFGPAEDTGETGGRLQLVILNDNHFITHGLDTSAALHGFNQVVPKSAGRLLATTSTGDPILTVWRLGLGRIATLSTDDGSGWASELLTSKNSKMIIKTINWIIGDPERKSTSFIVYGEHAS